MPGPDAHVCYHGKMFQHMVRIRILILALCRVTCLTQMSQELESVLTLHIENLRVGDIFRHTIVFFSLKTSTGIFRNMHTGAYTLECTQTHTNTLRQNPKLAVWSINRVSVRSPQPPSLHCNLPPPTPHHIICHKTAQPKSRQAAFKAHLN